MYKVPVRIAPSDIEGKGVFAKKDIAKDTKVWVFDGKYDIAMTAEEHDALPREKKTK